MKKPRVYIDTSVIGGCFDEDFAEWSKGLIRDFKFRHFEAVLSEVVAREIENAPEPVQQQYKELIDNGAELLAVGEEALDLLAHYQRRKILPPKFSNDLLHIALATVGGVDILVSWNFRHIVHYDKIRQFNAVNLELGYRALAIHSPMEVTTYG